MRDQSFPAMDPSQLDRLVDGELSQADRADLLRRLDAEPGGWRACALAFLEAQEFASASRAWALSHAPASVANPTNPIEGQAPIGPRRRRWRPARLGLAASIVALAFFSGWVAGERGAARRSTDSAGSGPADLASARPVDSSGPPVKSPEREWADRLPEAVPEYVRSQWERRGYQIEQSRRLISMDLEDGRRVTIPIDDVRVQFVGRQTY